MKAYCEDCKDKYVKQLEDCNRKIVNQRNEINDLARQLKQLKEGNIFGAFYDSLKEFREKFAVGFYLFSNKCPECSTKLSVTALYQYDKPNDKVSIIGTQVKKERG